MNIDKKEGNLVYSSPPYADLLVILDGNHLNNSINVNPPSISCPTRLDRLYDKYLKFIQMFTSLFLILLLLIFGIYQTVLGCYNCRLENSNLGWIRAAFLLNIPLLLSLAIYLFINVRKKKALLLLDVLSLIRKYIYFFAGYSFFIGPGFESKELSEIDDALNNATIVNSLPCPANHYRQMYILGIITLSSSGLFILVFCVWSCIPQSKSRMNKDKSKYDRFPFVIVRQWMDLTDMIFARHRGETVIERF